MTAFALYDQALCAQIGSEEFFPEKGGSVKAARRVCAACPVMRECLEFALENDERFGIWGGTTESERVSLRRLHHAQTVAITNLLTTT